MHRAFIALIAAVAAAPALAQEPPLRTGVDGTFAPHAMPNLAGGIQAPYDVVLLTCKAYDLDTALEAIAPAMGPKSVVIPMLNGLLHVDTLGQRFGREQPRVPA